MTQYLYWRTYADDVVSVASRLQRSTDFSAKLHCPTGFLFFISTLALAAHWKRSNGYG